MAKLVKMVNPLVIENKETGETITVEYNRAVIMQMDRLGIINPSFLQKMIDTPLTTASTLFYWGLKMHQPDMTEEEADELLFEKIGVDEAIFERLGELFMTPYNSIMDARKNSVWTVK